MNNITYENQGNNTYLVYEITENDVIDNLSLGMINNNKIMGLAPVIYTQIDNRRFLKYNISAKVSASTFLAGAASKNRILGVLSGVSKALLSAEEYMLDANSILLDLDYIFVDVTTCEAELICLPVQRGNMNDALSFFKNLVFSVTYDQTENCDYVAKIISCLNSHSSFSLVNFMQTIDELNGKRINLQELQNSQQLAASMERKAEEKPFVAYTDILPQETKAGPASTSVNEPRREPVNERPVGTGQGMQPVNRPVNMQQMPNRPVNMQQMANRGGTIPPNQPVNMVQNNNVQKKKPEKKKNVQPQPQANYMVPGAPTVRPSVMPQQMPGGQGMMMPQGQPGMQNVQKSQKKGLFGGLFHKKEKSPQMPKNPPMQPYGNRGNQGTAPVNMQGNIQGNMRGNMQRGMPQNMPAGNIPAGYGNTGNRPVQNIQSAPTPPAQEPKQRYMNFGETTVLGGEMANGETSVLSAPAEMQPYLVRKKNGEKVFVKGPIFRIGKENNYVDYFIGDNSAISRSHANITVNGSDYYIIDTNSKNHTYVNGQMIASNVETKLTHGTVLKLANEEFEFRMY